MTQRHSSRLRRLTWTVLVLIGLVGAFTVLRWSDIQLRYTVHKLRMGHDDEQNDIQAQLERLGKRSLSVFRRLLDDPRPRVRTLAVDSLGRLGEEEDFRRLVRALGDCDSEVRLRAVQSLPRWKNEHTVSVLANLLRDSDAELRVEAAKILGTLKDKTAVPALLSMLNDPDDNVVQFAVGSLRKLTGQRFRYRHVAPREEKQKALAQVRQWATTAGIVPAFPNLPTDLAQLTTPRLADAPNFSVSDGKGGSLQLSNFQDKVLLLNFFSPN